MVALVAALTIGCASSGPENLAERPQLEPEQAAPTPERPVSVKTDEGFIFPPAPPEGIYSVAVPAIVSETPAPLQPQSPATPDGLEIVAVDVPGPKSPKPKGRGVPMNQAVRVGPPGAAPITVAPGIGAEPPTPLAPALETSFDSLDFDDNSANIGSVFIPPDAHGAAGPDHVVSVVNVSLQVHNKTGTPLLDTTVGAPITGISLQSFFSSATATFDPKVLYDQFAGRWVIVTLEQTDVLTGGASDTSRILVAVSDDSDPTGNWTTTTINSAMVIGTNSWADYPGFAVDEEAIYITANMFGFFSFGGSFNGVRLWIIDKGLGSGGFYDGGMASVTVSNPYTAAGSVATTTQPAHVYCYPGSCPSPTGTYLVSYSGLTGGGIEFLQVVRVDDPLGTPTFTQEFISIGNLEDFTTSAGSALPDAPQLGSAELVEVNDRRALDAVWRDNRLFMTSTVELGTSPTNLPAKAFWWELDTTTPSDGIAGNGAETVVTTSGSIAGDDITADSNPVTTFFPSVTVNAANEIAIGFSASSLTIYPGSYYTTRKPADAAGTNSGSATLRAGTDYYIRTFDAPPCNAVPIPGPRRIAGATTRQPRSIPRTSASGSTTSTPRRGATARSAAAMAGRPPRTAVGTRPSARSVSTARPAR